MVPYAEYAGRGLKALNFNGMLLIFFGRYIPYRPGFKEQLMCAGVTAKLFDCFFLPTDIGHMFYQFRTGVTR